MCGRQSVVCIQDLASQFAPFPQFYVDNAKEASPVEPMMVWAGKWVKIARVIRHKTDKAIYRVHTGSSCVDVTADHSLIARDGTPLPPLRALNKQLLESHPARD